jgi:hypothetical protein
VEKCNDRGEICNKKQRECERESGRQCECERESEIEPVGTILGTQKGMSDTPKDDSVFPEKTADDLPKGGDLRSLQGEELTWEETPEEEDLDASETDDDEDEGVGDGNLGKSSPDLLEK